jgi:hypothetical protein
MPLAMSITELNHSIGQAVAVKLILLFTKKMMGIIKISYMNCCFVIYSEYQQHAQQF